MTSTTKFLTFQVHGPLVSWGERPGQQTRSSARVPTRSALVGLLAAATGIERSEDDRYRNFNENLGMAVTVLDAGIPMTEYQTVKPPAKSPDYVRSRRDELRFIEGNPDTHQDKTIETYREYRQDPFYYVTAWNRLSDRSTEGSNGSTVDLERLRSKLREPEFILYAGRKANVLSVPLNPKIRNSESFTEAFRKYHRKDSILARSSAFDEYDEENVPVFWAEDNDLDFMPEFREKRRRRDDPIDTDKDLYARRVEYEGRLTLSEGEE